MAFPARRLSVLLQLLLVGLTLAAAFSCADAARSPAALQEEEAVAPGMGRQPPATTNSDAVPVQPVAVDKFGHGGSHAGGDSGGEGGGGGDSSGAEGEGGGSESGGGSGGEGGSGGHSTGAEAEGGGGGSENRRRRGGSGGAGAGARAAAVGGSSGNGRRSAAAGASERGAWRAAGAGVALAAALIVVW